MGLQSQNKMLGHRCPKHNWSGLTAYAYPPTALFHKEIQNQAVYLPDHCNNPRLARDALVLGPSAALNRDPTSASSVNNSSQTVPQLCASQQATTSKPQRLVSRSGQLQEQVFSVEVAEKISAPQRSSTMTICKSSGPYLRIFGGLLHSLCERSLRFFRVPIPSSNRLPSTIDGYRTAIVDTLGPVGHHILPAQTLTGYSPLFSGIIPKFLESSKMEPFLSCLLSSHKHRLTL